MMLSILALLALSCNSGPDTTGNEPLNASVRSVGISAEVKENYRRAIQPMYRSLLLNTGFSGGILMAKNGEIIFEDYQGLYNRSNGQLIDSQSSFHLASISKTFTASVILRLYEQGKLDLEDPLETYISGFPYSGIRLKLLLNHRSGLPKYEHFMNDMESRLIRVKNRRGKWVYKRQYYRDPHRFKGLATNKDVVDYMIRHKVKPVARPDTRYQYCNTNYVLLALVIEKLTGRSYPDYLRDSLFVPLGMNNSYVFSLKDTASYVPSYNHRNAPYRLETFDAVYGDKNIYSTARDLFKWNEVLKRGTYVSVTTLQDLAYQPYSHETRGNKNYGLGWHLYFPNDAPPVIYHNGWWHGNNTVFKRLIFDDAVVIILGNKFNRNIWAAGKMSSVFTGLADTTLLEN
ncbi:MAG: serine hydrolase domain-containing protein [Sediminibacterium sp.]